jgi:hypothetical protein
VAGYEKMAGYEKRDCRKATVPSFMGSDGEENLRRMLFAHLLKVVCAII